MKNLKILLLLLVMAFNPILAQSPENTFDYDKADELMTLALFINPELDATYELSKAAVEALTKWSDDSFSNPSWDYIEGDYIAFAEVLDFKSSKESVLAAMKEMRTNIENEGLYDVSLKSAEVGAAYISIFDPEEGEYFGAYLILFKD